LPVSEQVPSGPHSLLVYQDDAVRRTLVADWVRHALDAGDKVLFQTYLPAQSREWIAGPDGVSGAGAALATGQLEMLDATAMGRFTGGKATALHALQLDQVREALSQRYTRVTVTADHTALHALAPDLAELSAHERKLGELVDMLPVRALCQYDNREDGPAFLEDMAVVHPRSLIDLSWAVSTVDDAWILSGELDASNHDRFAAALHTMVAATSRRAPVIDLSGLRFIDVESVKTLISAAADGGIVLRAPGQVVRRLLARLGPPPNVTVEDTP
jgi:anti-anti-sigma regulatory factor